MIITAQKIDYITAKKCLKENVKIIKNIFNKEGKDGIIRNFYEPYSIAYDNRDHNYCLNY